MQNQIGVDPFLQSSSRRQVAGMPLSRGLVFGLLLTLYFTLLLLVGVLTAMLPPVLTMTLMSVPVAVALTVVYPVTAFVGVLLLSFGLLPGFLMASIPLGGATLQPPEMMLCLLALILFFKHIRSVRLALAPLKLIAFPLAFLACGLAIGFVKGRLMANYGQSLAEFRHYVGWLALPVALLLAHEKPQILHKIVIGISLVASAAMVFQLLSGVQIIYGFRGAEELSPDFNDVVRSAIGGGVLLLGYSAYWFFGQLCNSERFRPIYLTALALVLGGLVASFSRGVWAGFAAGGLLFVVITPKFRRSKAGWTILLSMMVLAIGIAASMFAPRVGDAVIERILSVRDEGGRGSSVGFRIDEASQALAAIKRSPLFGLGLGGEYKRVFRQTGQGGGFSIEQSFIHNGYFALWLKLGIFGVLFPFVLIWCLFQRWLSSREETSIHKKNSEGMVSLASVLGAITLMMVYSISSPEWSQQSSLVSAASLIAIFLSIFVGLRQTNVESLRSA